jgi:two-component system, LytTR family, sensor kinase
VIKHDFIFSDKTSHRVARHLIFWFAFALIFSIQSFGDPLAGFITKDSVMHVLETDMCFLPFCILSAYIFSNFLFPVFLKKKKYAAFITGFLLVVALGVWIDYYAANLYFHLASVNTLTFGQKVMVDYNFVWSAILGAGVVLGIKLAKNWYQQQNENLLLAKQKANTELKLLKARIHPDFLFKSLDDIYKKINSGSSNSPRMILKLSEILSYLLYESDEELVALENELTAVNDFISISKLMMTDNPVSIKIVGNTANKFIVPLLLLSLVQNTFAVIFMDEKTTLKTAITISVEDDLLTLILSFQQARAANNYLHDLHVFIPSEQRRLSLLFPGNNCVLAMSHQENQVELSLIILLNTVDVLSEKKEHLAKKEVYETE